MKRATHRRQRTSRDTAVVVMAFLLSLLAFGGMFLLPYIHKALSDTASTETGGVQGYARTALLFVHDREERLCSAVTVTTDTRTMTVTAVGYPPHTEVTVGTALLTLDVCRREYGSEKTAAVFAEATGKAVDAVLTLSVGNAAALVTHAGAGVPYTLPESVGALDVGDHTLTPLQVADVLQYTGWTQGKIGQAAAGSGMVAAVFNRYLRLGRDLSADFSKLTELCEDKLTAPQFLAVSGELSALARNNNGAVASAFVASGREVGSGDTARFVVG